eukprot:gb/GECG01002126.1/.p1 GENE.gb/GECG01002126.1/~~gb/GECG01002126.1/.p1  ORF type:complete len:104 (+),score=4.85 gb/GECG01002126.1/:1-312(+)
MALEHFVEHTQSPRSDIRLACSIPEEIKTRRKDERVGLSTCNNLNRDSRTTHTATSNSLESVVSPADRLLAVHIRIVDCSISESNKKNKDMIHTLLLTKSIKS